MTSYTASVLVAYQSPGVSAPYYKTTFSDSGVYTDDGVSISMSDQVATTQAWTQFPPFGASVVSLSPSPTISTFVLCLGCVHQVGCPYVMVINYTNLQSLNFDGPDNWRVSLASNQLTINVDDVASPSVFPALMQIVFQTPGGSVTDLPTVTLAPAPGRGMFPAQSVSIVPSDACTALIVNCYPFGYDALALQPPYVVACVEALEPSDASVTASESFYSYAGTFVLHDPSTSLPFPKPSDGVGAASFMAAPKTLCLFLCPPVGTDANVVQFTMTGVIGLVALPAIPDGTWDVPKPSINTTFTLTLSTPWLVIVSLGNIYSPTGEISVSVPSIINFSNTYTLQAVSRDSEFVTKGLTLARGPRGGRLHALDVGATVVISPSHGASGASKTLTATQSILFESGVWSKPSHHVAMPVHRVLKLPGDTYTIRLAVAGAPGWMRHEIDADSDDVIAYATPLTPRGCPPQSVVVAACSTGDRGVYTLSLREFGQWLVTLCWSGAVQLTDA